RCDRSRKRIAARPRARDCRVRRRHRHRLDLGPTWCGPGHELRRHDPRLGNARHDGHDDGAGGLDAGLRATDVRDVVGDDGRDDAAECRTDAAAVRAREPYRESRERPFVPTGIFGAGYLAAWGGFGALATGLQWELERLGPLSPMMTTTGYRLGGAIPIAAGLWQLTPVKGACLRHCRSPLSFIAHGWRPGRLGAFRMGLEHGAYCLGCCWFLMGLLFFGGVMNLFWIGGLAAFVLLEKTIPMGHWLGRIAGVGVTAWGVLMLVNAAGGS